MNPKKPHIIIDARLFGPKHTGIGRYTQNLLQALTQLPNFKEYKFSLIIYKNLEKEIKKLFSNKFDYIVTEISHYSINEQIKLPFLIHKNKPDLVHFTHINKPIFYFGKTVVTVHDLIKHFFKGKETTTKNPILYWPKHLSYLVLTFFIIKTNHIIVPSNYWKKYITKEFNVNSKKITTTHEAVDPKFINNKNKITTNKPQNYIIYTGNLYPHKNIRVILEALKLLPDIKLKIICARNIFSIKIEKLVKEFKLQNQVEFLGFLKDNEFNQVYNQALALVHPSLMEGFSLTGLEAMALNCPVISSDKSCLPEIYGDSVLYFDPFNPNDLVSKINLLKNNSKLRNQLIQLGYQQLKKYDWQKTASQTFDVYQKLLS